MNDDLSIGDFSRMTQLSVTTLRHYHDAGLLTPARVDPHTGYRYYRTEQVPVAQVVRRLRALELPVADVRAVLDAAPGDRHALIGAHLARLEERLAATTAAVRSLRTLLAAPDARAIRRISVPATAAAAITADVDRGELVPWWEGAFAELRAELAASGAQRTGVPGATFGTALFAADHGPVTVFVSTAAPVRERGRMRAAVIPAAELAVTRHRGPHDDADVAYGRLGRYALGREISVDGPLREYYHRFHWDTDDPADWETDLCWPIFRADDRTAEDDAARGGSR